MPIDRAGTRALNSFRVENEYYRLSGYVGNPALDSLHADEIIKKRTSEMERWKSIVHRAFADSRLESELGKSILPLRSAVSSDPYEYLLIGRVSSPHGSPYLEVMLSILPSTEIDFGWIERLIMERIEFHASLRRGLNLAD